MLALPYEILFSTLEELKEKLRSIKNKGIKVEECYVKVNKDNVKFKVRTRRILYTAVLKPDQLGKKLEELKEMAVGELGSEVGCSEVKTLD